MMIKTLPTYIRYIVFILFMVIVWVIPALLRYILDFLFSAELASDLFVYSCFVYVFGTWYAGGHLFSVNPDDWGFEGYDKGAIDKNILIRGIVFFFIGSASLFFALSPFLALIWSPLLFYSVFLSI